MSSSFTTVKKSDVSSSIGLSDVQADGETAGPNGKNLPLASDLPGFQLNLRLTF